MVSHYTNSLRWLNNVALNNNGCVHDINNVYNTSRRARRSNTLRWIISETRPRPVVYVRGRFEKCKSLRTYMYTDRKFKSMRCGGLTSILFW